MPCRSTSIVLLLACLLSASSLTAQEATPLPPNADAVTAQFPLSDAQWRRLNEQKVLALREPHKANLWEAYDSLEHSGLPVLVTSDACLYLFYELHKDALKNAEQNVLNDWLRQLVIELWTALQRERSRPHPPRSQEALREIAVIIAVTGRLLGDDSEMARRPSGTVQRPFPTIPADLRNRVESLVGKVMAHREASPYPGEDFTQYTVRGHYDANETLRRYFRATKWLARRRFDVERDDHLAQAVALAWLLRQRPQTMTLWQKLHDTRRFLVNAPDGITPVMLLSAADKIWGKGWSLSQLESTTALRRLRLELRKPDYPESRINTALIVPEVALPPKKVVALLGEHYLPDSELFKETTQPSIVPRPLPTGLEVAVALGSQRAEELLEPQLRQHAALRPTLTRWRQQWAAMPEADWKRSVYNGWLWTLAALFREDKRAPEFAQTKAWQTKQVNTALSSWAQLRHSYVLYGAQTASYLGLSFGEGLIEPVPEFYRRLSALCGQLESALSKSGALSASRGEQFKLFREMLDEFTSLAEKTLAGQPLRRKEKDRLYHFASRIKSFSFETPVVVADVATDSQGRYVLHAGSGELHPILVLYRNDSGQTLCGAGWVMSYYEFAEPNLRRLTDAQWQQRLALNYAPPQPPSWMDELFGEMQIASSPLGGKGFLALLREAEEHKQRGDWNGAVAVLRRVSRQFPDSVDAAEAQFRLGEWLMQRRDWAGAIQELKSLRRLPVCAFTQQARRLVEHALWEQRWERKEKEHEQKLQPALAATNPKPGLSPSQERARQNRRAQTLMEAASERQAFDSTRRQQLLQRILKECPQSDVVPCVRFLLIQYEWVTMKFAERAYREPDTVHALIARWRRLAQDYPRRKIGEAAMLQVGVLLAGLSEHQEALKILKPRVLNSTALERLAKAGERVRFDDLWDTLPVRVTEKQLWLGAQEDGQWALSQCYETLIVNHYIAGEFDPALAVMKELRRLEMSVGGDIEEMEKRIKCAGNEHYDALRLFVKAQALWREGSDTPLAPMVDAYMEVARRYPDSPLASEALKEAACWLTRKEEEMAQLRTEWEQLLVRYCNSPSAAKAFKEAERDPRRNESYRQFTLPDIVETFRKLVEEHIRQGNLEDVERLLNLAAVTPLANVRGAQFEAGGQTARHLHLSELLDEQAQPLRQKLLELQKQIDRLLQGADITAGDYRLQRVDDFLPTLQCIARDAPTKARDTSHAAAAFVLQKDWLTEEDAVVVEEFLNRFRDDARADEVRWQFAKMLSKYKPQGDDVPEQWTRAVEVLSAIVTQQPLHPHQEEARQRLMEQMTPLSLNMAELRLPRIIRQHKGTDLERIAQLALAEVHLRHRRSDTAAETLRQLIQQSPTSPEAEAARPLLRRAEREIAARKQNVLDTLFVLSVPKDARLYRMGERLLVAADDLRCIEPKTRRVQWRSGVRPLGEPATDGKRVFVVTHESVLHCLDAATGAMLWRQKLPVPAGFRWNVDASGTPSPVVVATDWNGLPLLHLTVCGDAVLALVRESPSPYEGGPEMSDVMGGPPSLAPSPSKTISEHLLAYDVQTGALRWKVKRPRSAVTPVLAGQALFFSMTDGSIEAVDVTIGKTRWRKQLVPTSQGNIASWHRAPIIIGGRLVVAVSVERMDSSVRDDSLVCVDAATGEELWRQRRSGPRSNDRVSPHTDGKRLLVYANHSLLSELNPSTGATLWTQNLGAHNHECALLLHERMVFRRTENLNAFDFETGALLGESEWDVIGDFKGEPVVIGDVVYAIAERYNEGSWLVAMRAK